MSTTGDRGRAGTVPWAVLAALAAGLVAGYVLASTVGASARPTGTLLDARLPVTSEGAVFAFTALTPGDVRLWVRLEGCCVETRGEAHLGRLLPAKRPHLVYEPEAGESLQMAIGLAPAESPPWTLEHAGVHAVRIPPIPSAMGEAPPVAHVRVVRVGAGR